MTVHCRSLGGTLIIWLHIVMAVKAGFGLLPGNITAGGCQCYNKRDVDRD